MCSLYRECVLFIQEVFSLCRYRNVSLESTEIVFLRATLCFAHSPTQVSFFAHNMIIPIMRGPEETSIKMRQVMCC